jgi:hypothetical protein
MRPFPTLLPLLLVGVIGCGGGGDGAFQPQGYTDDPHGRGGTGGGNGTSFCLRITHKLQACGFMSQGEIQCDPDDEGEGLYLGCLGDCFEAASCAALENYYCDEIGTAAMYACFMACDEAQPHFTCQDGEEIPLDWACDGEPDCEDGSDEANCTDSDLYQCPDEDYYVPADEVCDGYEDCDDGSDEVGCPAGTGFACADGGVVPNEWACDGYDDCDDSSDEANCPVFACGDGQTVSAALRCDDDDDDDCPNGADEVGCAVWVLPCMADGVGGGYEEDSSGPADE